MELPKLIENQTRHFILENLRHCHHYRQKTYLVTWNLVIFITFVTIAGLTLYLCAQRKKYKDDNSLKKRENDQEYILNKIKEMREMENHQIKIKSMTQLPVSISVSSEYESKRLPEHSSGYSY